MGIEKLKTIDDRKARKPLLERKRRARINESLSELKSIVLQSLNKDSSRYTKMEKADILEMAVKHLKALRETVNGFSSTDGPSRYREGFSQCASEVTRYVMTMDTIDHTTRSELLSHLNTSCQSVYLSVPHATTSPPLSPVVQTRLFGGESQSNDMRYHIRPIAYPLPSFVTHTQPRHDHPTSDITYLRRNAGYHHHHSTIPHQANSTVYPRETSTATKETRRPEPVWRPW